jgi:hypothetical protein
MKLRFRREKQRIWRAAAGWERRLDEPLLKSKKLTDGQAIDLLVSSTTDENESLRRTSYAALLVVQEQFSRAIWASLAAYAFALLVYEGIISKFSISGIEVADLSFAHIALVLMSGTGLWASAVSTKRGYIASWFDAQFDRSPPSDRARLLLTFPQAFFFFQFHPSIRGYPPNTFPSERKIITLLFPIVLLIALLMFLTGSLFLWVALAAHVWGSNYPSIFASRMTVIGCGLVSLVAWLSPRFDNTWRRRYRLYGLTQLIAGMDEARKKKAHARIVGARVRMGLVPPVQK